MMRSLFTAISGLSNYQTFMDVIGNNIANVNTTGFKAARVTFQDLLSQTLRYSTAPNAQNGGTSPIQIGEGTRIGSISLVPAEGNLQTTQSPTDLAIQGDGFFVLSDGQGGRVYTRDGSFTVSSNGYLVDANGQPVLGWAPNPTTGLIDPTKPLQPLVIPANSQTLAQATSQVTFTGNLDQRLDATATNVSDKSTQETIDVYDSLGRDHQITITFEKTNNASNSWSWTASTTETGVTVSGSGTLTFDPTTGAYVNSSGTSPNGTLSLTLGNGATSPQSVNLSFTGLTQLASSTSLAVNSDGEAPGQLTSIGIDANGVITGTFSDGLNRPIGQVATATFANPQALLRLGGNDLTATPSSGNPIIGAPGTGGRGTLSSGSLEMSNVDLAQEFTNMIVAERGFQASSLVITVSDQILQDLVNLKQQ
jgi:flagellar hook protein FlgE